MEEMRQIYYVESENLFLDECSFTIYNILEIVSANMIYLLKSKKEDMFVYGVSGEFIELIYEADNEI